MMVGMVFLDTAHVGREEVGFGIEDDGWDGLGSAATTYT